MKKQWILFASRRLVQSRRKSRSSVTVLLSITGLVIGVTTLITVVSIMNGFQLETIEDLIELNSFHIRIKNNFPTEQELERLPEVELAAEVIESQALVRGIFSGSQPMMIKGIDGDIFQRDPRFSRRLGISPELHLRQGEVILGSELARFIGARPGDSIELMGLGGEDVDLSEPVIISLKLHSTFESGYYEFDRNWGIVTLDTAAYQLASAFRAEMAVKIRDRFADISAMRRIASAFPEIRQGDMESWREFNRSIFGALRVEKGMMSFLVGLIFLVVGVNIFQGLRRSVHERTEEIALLKVMGASDREVRFVFVLEGVLIGTIGTLIGLILGLLVSGNINGIFSAVEKIVSLLSSGGNFRIFSPSYFYIEKVPSRILPGELVFISLVSFLSAAISSYVASMRISSLRPREVLYNE